MMAAHALQTILKNRLERSVVRAVVERFGRLERSQFKVNLHAVPLVGPNACSGRVKAEALLVVLRHDLIEFLTAEAESLACQCLEQGVHVNPTARLEVQSKRLWFVPQVPGKRLADLYESSVHALMMLQYAVDLERVLTYAKRTRPWRTALSWQENTV